MGICDPLSRELKSQAWSSIERYRDDDNAVLPSGWSHIPGYIDIDRNTVGAVKVSYITWREDVRAKTKKDRKGRGGTTFSTRRLLVADFYRVMM
jgi:hypothetical protein